MRLDRYLSEMGVESRSKIRELCRRGRVKVNGVSVRKSDVQVVPGEDSVSVDGETVFYREYEYYMLNKPSGVVTAVSDSRDKTVMDLITGRTRKDLFPVGRLDRDTEGLLLITNDGELAKRLLAPKSHVPKRYAALIQGEVTEDHVRQFREGLDIGDDRMTLPAELEILSSGEQSEIIVTVTEGRFHQVKRMFHAVGTEVIFLKRMSMGSLCLDPGLEPGNYRELTEEEIQALKACSGN